MGACFLYGNGGSGEKDRLKLRVLYGMTAPANPQENDVWLQTDVAILGWEFSDKKAGTVTWAMPTGFVYFDCAYGGAYDVRNSTGLNFLNQNAIYTKLLGCIQYDGSAWKKKDAWIYHGSQWYQFSSKQYSIFNAGAATDYSGGWKAYAYKSQSSGSTPKAPTFSVGSTFNIDLYGQYEYNMGTVFSEAAIDLSKYSTLEIEVASTQTGGAYGGFSCGVCAAKQNNWTPVATATNVGAGTHSIDISSLSGSYYLSLSLGGVGQGVTAKAVINRIILK